MEHTERDTAQNAAPQEDWQNAETATPIEASQNDEFRNSAPLYAAERNDDPEEEEEDNEDEDDAGDWGHVDPAESNSPFPDPNEPTAPGSAV